MTLESRKVMYLGTPQSVLEVKDVHVAGQAIDFTRTAGCRSIQWDGFQDAVEKAFEFRRIE